MATRMTWAEMPAWLRRLAVDAKIYSDRSVASLVNAARNGDPLALKACRMVADR